MKLPLIEKIICRDRDRVLVLVKSSINVNGNIQTIKKFEVWNDIKKYELGVAAEIKNNAYYVYMFTIHSNNEYQAKQIFYSLK